VVPTVSGEEDVKMEKFGVEVIKGYICNDDLKNFEDNLLCRPIWERLYKYGGRFQEFKKIQSSSYKTECAVYAIREDGFLWKYRGYPNNSACLSGSRFISKTPAPPDVVKSIKEFLKKGK
jgi:hypothetical protein